MTLNIDLRTVDKVRDIAVRAGKERKEDASPVTEADRTAEAVIVAALRREVTDVFPIVAEEAVAAGYVPEVGREPFWLVDPLDGTKQFVGRKGEFTVNIALIEGFLPRLGVVHAPAIGASYWGSPHGAFAVEDGGEPQPIHCRPFPSQGVVAVASRSHRTPETDAYLARYDVAETISSGSSIKFCLVAAGRADLYPRAGRTMEWDTAAGHAVVRAAGGTVETMEGDDLTYAKPGFENPHFVVRGAEPGA